jgi:hypothetical protein
MILATSPSLGLLFLGGVVALLFDGVVSVLLIGTIQAVGRADEARAEGS